jgi:large subunit ribosomal protein L4
VQVPVYNTSGEVVRQIELSDRVFAEPFREALVHQAMVRQRANARQGTACTKTRSEVSGSTRKLFRQKHTGNARAGSRRSPIRRGGGVAFGPKPRSYAQAMPRKMRRLALRCLLSVKVRDDELKVVDALEFAEPKTRQMAGILSALGINSSTLLVTGQAEPNIYKSARNLAWVKTSPAGTLNVIDLLDYRTLVMTEAAVRRVEEMWGQEKTEVTSDASV